MFKIGFSFQNYQKALTLQDALEYQIRCGWIFQRWSCEDESIVDGGRS
jgi:hypothetical protein